MFAPPGAAKETMKAEKRPLFVKFSAGNRFFTPNGGVKTEFGEKSDKSRMLNEKFLAKSYHVTINSGDAQHAGKIQKRKEIHHVTF